MTPDDMRSLLLPILARPWTARERRQLADVLVEAAESQRRLADAAARDARRPAAQRVAPKAGRGGRPSTPWLRVEERQRAQGEATELRLKLSRALYDVIGTPERIDVQRVSGELLLAPAQGSDGYAVVANVGGVWINASGSRDVVRLANGKYEVELRGTTVVIR